MRPIVLPVLVSVLCSVVIAFASAVQAATGTEGVVAQSNGNTDPDPTPSRVECADAEGDLVPLCEAYRLITNNHIDTVTAQSLAEKAAEYVRDAGLDTRTDGMAPLCPLPTA